MTKMSKILKQAQKMQSKMDDVQKELTQSIIEVETGGGAVKIEISGDQILSSIKIDPGAVDPKDVDGLEDLLLTSVNQAIQESKKYAQEKTEEVSKEMNLPEGFPF
jgi:nucleoid-associated protein EbfC